jgi:Tfp pilus assembly protein PilZ
MSTRTDKLPSEQKIRIGVGKFDKAFPVFLEGDDGVAGGIGRNITDGGMFVETREPFPLGSRVKVTFFSPHGGAEMTLEGEIRYQCYINFARADATRAGMRGIGLKFVSAQSPEKSARGAIH